MTAPLLTASKVGLLLECGYSFRNDVAIIARDASSEAATRGTQIHDAIHRLLSTGDIGADALSMPEADQRSVSGAAAWALAESEACGRPLTTEVAYELSRDGTVRVLGTGREAYGQAKPGTICGTADLVIPGKVVDWKTGEHGAYAAEPQMLALAAMAIGDRDSTEWQAVYLPEHGEPRVLRSGEVTQAEAVAIRAGLFEAYDAAQGSEPTPGEHCSGMYCPLVGKCPAYTVPGDAIASQIVSVGEVLRKRIGAPIDTVADAVDTLAMLKLFDKYTDALSKEARAKVQAAEGFGESEYYVAKTSAQTRQGIDAKAALALAEKLGAQPHELAACMTSSSFDVLRITERKPAIEATPKPKRVRAPKQVQDTTNDTTKETA